jgi:hypothetical protein
MPLRSENEEAKVLSITETAAQIWQPSPLSLLRGPLGRDARAYTCCGVACKRTS